MFFVTTLPAPITTLSQILTGKIVEFDPIKTLFPTLVGNQFFIEPPNFFDENLSLVKFTLCPIKHFFQL